jgi:formylglycine-generating enzyme required for sulfatase activity
MGSVPFFRCGPAKHCPASWKTIKQETYAMDVRNFDKGKVFIRFATRALILGLKQIPGAGMVLELIEEGHGVIEQVSAEQGKQSLEERLARLEAAMCLTPEQARTAAAEAIADARVQGEAISAEKEGALLDIVSVMPATIRERTQATLMQARRYGTVPTTVIPVGEGFTPEEREAYYASLFPARRPCFRAQDCLPNGNPEWHLEALIGAGGFGEVWTARHRFLGDRLAVKFCQDAAGARVLQREAETLYRLKRDLPPNPYIVALRDLQLTQEPYWLAFEYVPGGTLEGLMRAHTFGWEEALALLRPLVSAMAEVHRLKIVHRDLKPANILLDEQGTAKITDFGIGKVTAAQESAERRTRTRFTTQGYGSRGYMSPEQEEGTPAHPSDDTYALGVILWQMLAGMLKPIRYPGQIQGLAIPQEGKQLLFDCLYLPRATRPRDAEVLKGRLATPSTLLRNLVSRLPIDVLKGRLTTPATPRAEHPVQAKDRPKDAPRTAAPVHDVPRDTHGWTTVGSRQVTPQVPSGFLGLGTKTVVEVVDEIDDASRVQALQRQVAEAFGKPVLFRDRLKESGEGPELVIIPPGRFQMGSPDDEPKRDKREGPQHAVTLTKPFALGRYAMTVGEFRRSVTARGYKSEAEQGGGAYGWTGSEWKQDKRFNWQSPGFEQGENHPVVCVSWNDAVAYCQWLSEQTGAEYRLPSEAQWEYACRAGTTTPFWWGNTITPQQANYNGNYPYNKGEEGEYRRKTVPVDQFEPNPWGLYQMHGNVWEWVQDWYAAYKGEAQTDPIYAQSGSPRVFRGGSWYLHASFLRAACRRRNAPGFRVDHLGFRPARTL